MTRFKLPKTEYPLSEDSATACAMELITFYSMDIEAIEDKQTRGIVEDCASKLVRFYRMALLENIREGADLIVKQHFREKHGDVDSLTWKKMDGKAKLATDGYDPNDRYARAYALADYLTGSVSGTVEKLSGVDLAVVENLGSFFLLGSS